MQRIVDERSISRIVHFHCDHFEPLRRDASGELVGLEAVTAWNEARLQSRHLQKLSLFYTSQWCCSETADEPTPIIPRMLPFDDPRISHLQPQDMEVASYLAEQPGLDMHVHVHHEWWTSSAYSGIACTREQDSEALSSAIRGHLHRYEELWPAKNWCFIHGCWSLNASDTSVCRITDEMRLLLNLGCAADFTFPAGRTHCNPTVQHAPYTVLPVVAEKGYDRPDAMPITVAAGAGARKPGRLLIWNAATPYNHLSIETLVEENLPPAVVAASWLATSPIIAGTLYIKTHCHSLWWEHWAGKTNVKQTLLSQQLSNCFDQLVDLTAPFEHWTVREVLAALKEL